MTPLRYEGRDLEAMSFARNYYQWVVDIFAPFLHGRVGEVGAGCGNFSSLLLDQQIEALTAIEPSNEMYPLLAEKFSQNKRVACRHAFFKDVHTGYANYFDALVYVNVLEHIPDDRQELRYIYDSLHAGGTACIFVPALQWLYSDFDASVGHYRRYHKKHLRALMEEAGFDIVTIRYVDLVGIVPWFIFFKVLKQTLTTNNTVLYDRFVVPIARSVESRISIPFGKNLIVVGRKKG